MASTKFRRYAQAIGLRVRENKNRASEEDIWSEEAFLEDVKVIANLMNENKLSQEDGEFVLSLLLSLYVSDEVDLITDRFEDAFEQMFHRLALSIEK